MGKNISVTLGREFFPKKLDVQQRIRLMIESYQLMSYIDEPDKNLCLNLFAHHPDYLKKLGIGIEAIQVRLDDYGHRYFHLHRIDGSDEDISWVKCLASIK
jgi:hypothetical protein